MLKNLELKVVAGKTAGQVIVIPPAGATIGRQPPAEVVLDEPAVSRQHCSIYPRRNGWCVKDLDSQNGTLLNGVPISKEVLQPGDRIQVGDTVLRMPPNRRKQVLVGAATAAGVLIAVLVWHWAAASGRSAPASAAETVQESASATANSAGAKPLDSDLTDSDLLHPGLKRLHR